MSSGHLTHIPVTRDELDSMSKSIGLLIGLRTLDDTICMNGPSGRDLLSGIVHWINSKTEPPNAKAQ